MLNPPHTNPTYKAAAPPPTGQNSTRLQQNLTFSQMAASTAQSIGLGPSIAFSRKPFGLTPLLRQPPRQFNAPLPLNNIDNILSPAAGITGGLLNSPVLPPPHLSGTSLQVALAPTPLTSNPPSPTPAGYIGPATGPDDSSQPLKASLPPPPTSPESKKRKLSSEPTPSQPATTTTAPKTKKARKNTKVTNPQKSAAAAGAEGETGTTDAGSQPSTKPKKCRSAKLTAEQKAIAREQPAEDRGYIKSIFRFLQRGQHAHEFLPKGRNCANCADKGLVCIVRKKDGQPTFGGGPGVRHNVYNECLTCSRRPEDEAQKCSFKVRAEERESESRVGKGGCPTRRGPTKSWEVQTPSWNNFRKPLSKRAPTLSPAKTTPLELTQEDDDEMEEVDCSGYTRNRLTEETRQPTPSGFRKTCAHVLRVDGEGEGETGGSGNERGPCEECAHQLSDSGDVDHPHKDHWPYSDGPESLSEGEVASEGVEDGEEVIEDIEAEADFASLLPAHLEHAEDDLEDEVESDDEEMLEMKAACL